jgi:2-haloalkanoic acid dehalogenase type II
MRLSDFRVLSFDCYGTLIDWETGILRALETVVSRSATSLTSDQLLQVFARHEAAQEAETPSMIYSKLLGVVHGRIATELGIRTTDEENARFGASIKDWPAFPDSAPALRYLKRYYQLVILSNVDRDSFQSSNARLQVEFDQIYTAQDIGSYKPDLRNFQYLISKLSELGCAKKDILHTAEGLFHDHAPANRMGLASAWIHRRHAKEGFGATFRPTTMPDYDFRFTSMQEMAQAHEKEQQGAA